MVYETSYGNSLQHHGIKGQKWGVRRYQNPDGTLTAKGKKRLAKNQAYREKLANKANKRAERNKKLAEDARADIKDLEDNGIHSRAYKDWKETRDRNREWEYENRESNSIRDANGDTYVKKYSRSGEKFANDLFDAIGSKQQVAKLIEESKENEQYYTKRAEKWVNSNKNLMNMTISVDTKKSDIRKTFHS